MWLSRKFVDDCAGKQHLRAPEWDLGLARVTHVWLWLSAQCTVHSSGGLLMTPAAYVLVCFSPLFPFPRLCGGGGRQEPVSDPRSIPDDWLESHYSPDLWRTRHFRDDSLRKSSFSWRALKLQFDQRQTSIGRSKEIANFAPSFLIVECTRQITDVTVYYWPTPVSKTHIWNGILLLPLFYKIHSNRYRCDAVQLLRM